MAAQTTCARRSRCGKSRVSWTLAAEGTAAKGMPSVETTTWYLVPGLPRSVGLGPVSSPPRLARTEQLSTTTSQEAASGPARTIRIRATWTWRSRAVALQPSRRRRRVEPQARPAAARSCRHCTPSRTKKRSVSTTSMVGRGGRPVPYRRSSIRSMIPATNAAALDAMLASRCRRHGKRAPGAPDAERLTSYGVLETAPKGARLPNLSDVLADEATSWAEVAVPGWYGEGERVVEVCSATAVWRHAGLPVVPIRWVLLRDPQQRFAPQALLCTDPARDPLQIVRWFIQRWPWWRSPSARGATISASRPNASGRTGRSRAPRRACSRCSRSWPCSLRASTAAPAQRSAPTLGTANRGQPSPTP